MTKTVEGGFPLAGPLTRKMLLRDRQAMIQLKQLLIKTYREKLSEKYGSEKVNPWIKRINQYLSKF